MASKDTSQSVTSNLPSRGWLEFQFSTYSRIAARKHGLSIPTVDLTTLSDEDLVDKVKLLQELAHLPPG